VSVRVYALRPGTDSTIAMQGERVTDVVHSDGASVQVVDEHLYVDKENGSTLAIYAPGRWASAELT
jgi:hypothetical protein